MISERTRDKMHAARRKGKWTGGNVVLGYDVVPAGGAISVNQEEAKQLREIFQLYLKLGTLLPVIQQLEEWNWTMKSWKTREGRTRGGARFTKTTLHNLLTNVIYTGRVRFGGQLYAGEHERIVDDETWNRVQERLNRNGRRGGQNVGNKYGGLLKGLVRCESCRGGMTHTYTNKGNRVYRYYVCINAHQRGWNKCATRSVSASELEGAVVNQIRGFARHPSVLSEVLQRIQIACKSEADGTMRAIIDPDDVRSELVQFDRLWDQLTINERVRFIGALVTEVRYTGPTQTVAVGFQSATIKEYCETNA